MLLHCNLASGGKKKSFENGQKYGSVNEPMKGEMSVIRVLSPETRCRFPGCGLFLVRRCRFFRVVHDTKKPNPAVHPELKVHLVKTVRIGDVMKKKKNFSKCPVNADVPVSHVIM